MYGGHWYESALLYCMYLTYRDGILLFVVLGIHNQQIYEASPHELYRNHFIDPFV